MPELTAFNYRPGRSLLHGLNVRCKLAFLILISLSSLKAGIPALFVATMVFAVMIIDIRLSFKTMIKELRYFLVLLSFVFLARALTTPGSMVFGHGIFSFTREGIADGFLVCWRLLLIVAAGMTFVSTTRMSEIKAAVQWFLAPVPFVPEQRAATMLSLLVRFMPLLLHQAGETADAQRARGVENRKNPVYRLKKLALPLIRRTFVNADKLAVAMEARCYSGKRTDPDFSTSRKDWIGLVSVICYCAAVVVF